MTTTGISRGQAWIGWASLAMAAVLLVLAFGQGQTTRRSYHCTICGQSWARQTTTIAGIPVWMKRGRHTATSHPPTYTGGGFSVSRWSIIGGQGSIGCGRHSEHSS